MPPPFVDVDLLQGGSGSKHVVQGTSMVRVATVREIPIPDIATWSQAKAYAAALAAVIEVVGGIGTSCPDVDDPTFLERFEPEQLAPDIVRVRIYYKGFPNLSIEIGTCLSQFDTNTDKDGGVITVSYQYPSSYLPDPRQVKGTLETQGGFVSKPIPETTMTFHYTAVGNPEGSGGPISASSVVLNFAQSYVGKVNSATWASAPGAARTWLCERVQAVSRDGGITYELGITFHYRPDTWDALVTFINPDTGKPPPDYVNGVGQKRVQVYKSATLPTMPV